MSLKDTTAPSQSETVSLDFDLPHAPEKVWRSLSDPALLSTWLLPVVDFKLQHDASFKFSAPRQLNWDGVVNCRIREIDAHKKLSYNWVVGDIDTVVTFTLIPTASGTRLSLVQSGFKTSQKKNFGGARYGLRLMGQRLVDLLASIS